MQQLEIKVALQIQKTAQEVFEAIADPAKMSNYFISAGSGRMEAGRKLVWKFPEFDMEIPVNVGKVVPPEYISWHWQHGQKELLVEIRLRPFEDGATVVTITEGKMQHDDEGIEWLKGNTEGWANFLACLKAWLEHGVHLRKGAFDFRKDEFEKMKNRD